MNFILFAHVDYIFTHSEHIIANAEYMFALGEQRIDNVYKQKKHNAFWIKYVVPFKLLSSKSIFVKSNDSLQYPGI